jgi:tetratricopeptide (TPR) repeat protein
MHTASHALRNQDWITVSECADRMIKTRKSHPDGYFFKGLVEKAKKNPAKARSAFRKVLDLNENRYDAAIELANQYAIARRNKDAFDLLARYEPMLGTNAMYLDLAGNVFNDIGMPNRAFPLFKAASELQPGIDLFQANFASSAVFMGEIELAREIYSGLLERNPGHTQNHYQLSRLGKAKDERHIDQMKALLGRQPPDKNIFLYFAIGKELEDLEQWGQAFEYYKKGNDTVMSVANYDVRSDLAIIEKVKDVCTREWLVDDPLRTGQDGREKTPLFIVGLPRTGTTLTERIIASHSSVQSLGETMFFQMVLRRDSRIETREPMNVEILEYHRLNDMNQVANGYEQALSYRLGEEPVFIDKLPFNFLYLGFIAKAWPEARILHVVRKPMDACFSMYKQVFTWAYKYSYSLDTLAQYYIAYDELRKHWAEVLGDRLVEVQYEDLVTDTETQTRTLLENLGLPFEQACLDFDKNKSPTTTASSVQVRQKTHKGSVNRWLRFERQLQAVRERLSAAGVDVSSYPA